VAICCCVDDPADYDQAGIKTIKFLRK